MNYKTSGYEAAKEFAEELTCSMDMIKKFFTVKPIDMNADVEFDSSKMIALQLHDDFINGYKCTFIFSLESKELLSFKAEALH